MDPTGAPYNFTETTDSNNCSINSSLQWDECLYPYKVNMTVLDTYDLVMNLPVNLVIAVLGVIGNTLAYLVMSREVDATCSTLCLKGLAITDNFVLLTFSLYFSLPIFWKYLGVCIHCTVAFELLKPYLWLSMWFWKTLSIYLIVLMTVERFVAVCMPLKALKWCTKATIWRGIIAIIILDFAYNLPKLLIFERRSSCDRCTGQFRPKSVTKALYRDELFRILYTKTLYYLVMYVIPLLVLFVLNILLIGSIKKARRFRRRSVVVRTATASNDKATERIIGVVIAFLVLETPALLYNVLTIFRDHARHLVETIDWDTTTEVMRPLYIVSMINSFINIYVYCLVGRRFRRDLWRMLTCRKSIGRGRRPISYSSVRTSNPTESTLL